MDSSVTFSYNISFTTVVNGPEDGTKLTAVDLWAGVAHVARMPQEFAPYVAKCDVLWETVNGKRLGRAITLGDGGVHTGNGQVLYQGVSVADRLQVDGRMAAWAKASR
ncbi:hypothetical protein CCHR01_13668 [Colletotrichum chrysophilum]|uniref:Uncharacterized protein n=1 Tax=Colletotrichum chrysophilum TaxID=1836956 RepID=A0AAD9A924_9PEZI|nr:hypothetical protein CCHR01_13668 [Colletotrichum chrysophilum]